MHDPLTVAFEIKRPWRDPPDKLFPKGWRPPIVTIWHRDPEKHGDDDSCDWFGGPAAKGLRRWVHPRWHVWHWRIQVHAIQALKRWLFSRCAACGKRFPWNYSPVTTSWNGHGPRWFRGEPHTYHHDCAPISNYVPRAVNEGRPL